MRSVAEIGFVGVEPFGLDPNTAPRMRELCDELGLAIPSVHVPMPLGARQGEAVETALALGATRMVSGLGPEEFQDLSGVYRSCERFNEAYENAAAHGLSFGIHNHWWEYEPVEGQYPYQVMLERLNPAIFFELDFYWAKTGGVDPQRVIAELGQRTPLLHVKDGPAKTGVPMTAVGQGTLDIPAIIVANEGTTEWLLVELDDCATDMMTAVKESFDYLVETGLGVGKE